MTEADLEDVLEIARSVFTPPWSRDAFEAELARPFAAATVIEVEGAVVAYAIAWCLPPELEVLAVATHPSARRRGHARRLVGELLDASGHLGIERGFLEVRADNAAALALYEALGFRVESTRAAYYADGVDARLMAWARAT